MRTSTKHRTLPDLRATASAPQAKLGRGMTMIRALFFIAALLAPAHAFGASIPKIGCPMDGQMGPLAAPRNGTMRLASADGAGLAYFYNRDGFGVLGPRGWHCQSLYGSNGTSIYLTPKRISNKQWFSAKGIQGPMIQISVDYGETSGRFAAARVIARVFPQERKFVEEVIAEKIEPAADFPLGPALGDRLTRKSASMVEYETPPGVAGLGTLTRFAPSDAAVTGVVILLDVDHDILQLAMQLPPDLQKHAPAILREVEASISGSR